MNAKLRHACLVGHYWGSLFAILISIVGIVCFAMAKGNSALSENCPTYAILRPLVLAICVSSLINNLFLTTIDMFRTRTWAGTFMVQHIILAAILASSGAILAMLAADRTPTSFWLLVFGAQPSRFKSLEELGVISALTTAGLTLGTFVSMVYCFASARRWQNSQVGWLVNTKDLLLDNISDQYPTFMGAVREDSCLNYVSHSIKAPSRQLSMFFYNMFFRRVPEVETKAYAFFINILALLMISALCVRASISLSLAEDRPCRLRTRVEECYNQTVTCENARFATMYGSSTPDSDKYTLDLDVIKLHLNGSFQESRACIPTLSGPFKVFDCSVMCEMNTPDNIIAFNVTMRSTSSSALDINPPLKVWFSDTDPKTSDIADISGRFAAPNQLAGWQLLPGYSWRSEIGLKKRKFILSSFFHDIVIGNYPVYLTINLRPITTTSTLERTSNSVASGLIFPASQGSSAMMDPDANLPDTRSYVGCEVIEEYRDGSPFDILGSIGGLLALAQGIYAWLVGRPLLWGLTGAKTISPFGLIGSFTNSSFRQKLRSHYRVPGPGDLPTIQPQELQDMIRITTFLRDYVLDMGPADIPSSYQRQISSQRVQPSQPPS